VSEGKNDNEKEFRKTEHEEKTGKQNVEQLSGRAEDAGTASGG